MPTDDGDPAGAERDLRAALDVAFAGLADEQRTAEAEAAGYRSLAIGLRLGIEQPERARLLLESIEERAGGRAGPGADVGGVDGAVAPDDLAEPGTIEAPPSIPVTSMLLARAARVPPEERANLGPEVIFGWAARLTSGEIVSLGRVVDDMLAAGSPPDIARGFGIAWSDGVRLPREELDALFREFPELEVTVAGVLAGRDLRAIPPAPRPGGVAALFDPWVHRRRPEESQAAAEFEKRGEPAQRGLVAVWNAWVAMRCRQLMPPATFELLVHPWVMVVGALPED